MHIKLYLCRSKTYNKNYNEYHASGTGERSKDIFSYQLISLANYSLYLVSSYLLIWRNLTSRDQFQFWFNLFLNIVSYTWLVYATWVLIETLVCISGWLSHLDLQIMFGFDLHNVICNYVLLLYISIVLELFILILFEVVCIKT